MFCPNCGKEVQNEHKFCQSCGKAVAPPACSSCGSPVKPDAIFCPNCGRNLKSAETTVAPPPPLPPAASAGIASDLKDIQPGEVVLMDTGHFPITYVKNLMTSINGKLYLTNRRLVFKAGALQGVGGVAAGGLFVPNMNDANKSTTYFAIPLPEVSSVENGWANITVNAREKYKFGGMLKPKDWANEIRRLLQSR